METRKITIENNCVESDIIKMLLKDKILYTDLGGVCNLTLKSNFKNNILSKYISKYEIFEKIRTKNSLVIGITKEVEDFFCDRSNQFSYHIITDIDHLDKTKNTPTLLGYDIQNTTMGIVLKDIHNHTLNDITPSSHTSYQNKITIHYCSEEDIGNFKLASNTKYRNNILETYKNYLDEDTLLCDFNFSDADSCKFTNLILPKVPHGINNPIWMDKTKIAIFSHFRYTPEEQRLMSYFGKTLDDIDRAREGNMFVQIMARSKIRIDPTVDIDVFVIDKRSAECMKNMLVGCNVNLVFHKMNKVLSARSITISPSERRRLKYLRYKKKNNLSKFTKENQEELSRLVLKMNTK